MSRDFPMWRRVLAAVPVGEAVPVRALRRLCAGLRAAQIRSLLANFVRDRLVERDGDRYRRLVPTRCIDEAETYDALAWRATHLLRWDLRLFRLVGRTAGAGVVQIADFSALELDAWEDPLEAQPELAPGVVAFFEAELAQHARTLQQNDPRPIGSLVSNTYHCSRLLMKQLETRAVA